MRRRVRLIIPVERAVQVEAIEERVPFPIDGKPAAPAEAAILFRKP